MRNFKSRSFLHDALFVVLIMVAAMASAVMEAAAVLGGFPVIDAIPIARSAPSSPKRQASGPSVDGALLSVAAPGPAR